MNQATARRELREARKQGFCGFCFGKGERGKELTHKTPCKIVTESGLKRRKVKS